MPFHPAILGKIALCFDHISHAWERSKTQNTLALYLFWVYILSLIAIQLNIEGLYPEFFPKPPASHFASISLAFTLILIMELLSLIFILPSSLSTAIGKQFEILTLILLRNAFKELTTLAEPVRITTENIDSLLTILVSSLGALAVFICLGFFRRIIKHPHFIKDHDIRKRYVLAKKVIAFSLMLIFIGIGIHDLYDEFTHGTQHNFFETIYTVLIFADIAIVLISQRYMGGFYAVFRNSGYVIGTLLMRLALSAPPLWSPCLGVISALFVIGLTWGTNKYIPETLLNEEKP